MRLADLSINQPVFITMIVIVVLVVGAISFLGMGLDLFPDVSLPVVAVQTAYPGASPEEVESLVSKPIEEALASLNRVQAVRSTSSEGLSTVIVEFDMDYSSRAATEDVRERVATVRPLLPSDVLDPSIARYDPASMPILIFAISDRRGVMAPAELRAASEKVVQPRVERVDGVASVSIAGGLEREIHVDLDLNRVRAHNIPVQQIVGAIKAENLNLPGGRLTQGQNERLIRTAGEFRSVEEIETVQVPRAQGPSVLLRDLASVSEGYKEARVLSRLNGRDAVTMWVRKQAGTNTVRVADGVKKQLSALQQTRPDLSFTVVADQSTFTRDSSNDVMMSLVFGGLLAALVVLLFFRDVRNTLVTVAGLPMIIFGTFAAMKLLGLSLNMITLMALSISVGMLIDDAIVVRENIFRHTERGEDPRVAASAGTAEIALAVMATTFTIVAVFGPIAFVTGIAGKFFREFGLTVVMAVLISLFEAFTLAPMLSAHFFKAIPPEKRARGSATGGFFGRVRDGYRALLAWSLRYRAVVVFVSLAVFAASVMAFSMLGQAFMAQPDTGEARISLELPPGSSLAQTDEATRRVEGILLSQPELEYVFSQVGSSDSGVDQATVYLKVKRIGQTAGFVKRIRPMMSAIPDLTYTIDDTGGISMGAGVMMTVRGRPLQINVQGQNFEDLDRASQMIVDALKAIPGTVDVGRSLTAGKPEAQVRVDRALAADLGVNTGQVGATVRTLVNGETASKFRTPDKDYDIVVRLREDDRQDFEDILQLPLATTKGNQIPLGTVAAISSTVGPTQIDREDRQRQIVVGAGYQGRDLGEVIADARKALARMELPAGVGVAFSGQAKYLEDMMQALMIALVLSVVFIYMVLGSQFGSFVQPLVIMLSLPLSIVGAAGALLVTGKSLDMMAFIGVIMLMGLVTKNAILIVDFINNRRRAGMERNEAILVAGPIRLRPILMTTLAMIFGMTPIALGLGAGAELRSSMAVTVIGGLVTSTALSLLVVPVAYTLVDDVVRRLRPIRELAPEASPAIVGSSDKTEG
ncbi:MAG: efflux RND transporter permease subunit [Chloroflexi bacterium]|nr:efflux RND transporter permease subunit [Chloroflexota bacterium]